jgi:hypothetical protein
MIMLFYGFKVKTWYSVIAGKSKDDSAHHKSGTKSEFILCACAKVQRGG